MSDGQEPTTHDFAPKSGMTPEELATCMDAACWTVESLVQRYRVRRQTAVRWIHGRANVPPPMADDLRNVALFFAVTPYQDDTAWRDMHAQESAPDVQF